MAAIEGLHCIYNLYWEINFGEYFNLAIWRILLKIGKLKFSSVRNVSAVVATPETQKKKKKVQIAHLPIIIIISAHCISAWNAGMEFQYRFSMPSSGF